MKVAEKLTEELLNEIMFARALDEVLDKEFVRNNTLSEYLDILLKKKNFKKSDIIKKSNLNTTFAYQIFSGQRHASRDKILQLIFAFQATLSEAQRILKLSGVNELYSKNRRDAIIIFCLKNNNSLVETDDVLYDYGEPLICNDT
jgi:predicted transcriptional regulator